jgi:hypothetical protein
MRDRINESVMLFVATNLADEKSGVQDQANDYHDEEDDPKDEHRHFAPIENDPANVQRGRQRHQARAQGYEESD